jgi:hypothetical protein
MESLDQYYHSKEWTNELVKRIGMDSLAVQLNSRFAFDLLNECQSEYAKTQDTAVFHPLKEMDALFYTMMKNALAEYNNFLHLKSGLMGISN